MQLVLLGDDLTVLERFRRIGVALLRNEARLLEEWEIDQRLDIARGARITIPVPGVRAPGTGRARILRSPNAISAACPVEIIRNSADGPKRSISRDASRGEAIAPTAYQNMSAAESSTR